MVEALINYYSIEHFIFGFGTAVIISMLLRKRHPTLTISICILILWEIFEFTRGQRAINYWITNYQNNIMDVIVGFVAVVIGWRAFNLVYKK